MALLDALPRIVHININSADKRQYESMTGLDFETTVNNAKRFIAEAGGRIQVEINCPVLPEVDIEKLIDSFPGVKVNAENWANSRGGLLEGITSKGHDSRFKLSDYCLQPEQNFNILFDGSVVLCCLDWAHESKMDFPNIMDSSILEIYSSDIMQSILHGFKNGHYGRYKMCRQCSEEMGFINKNMQSIDITGDKELNVKKYKSNYINRTSLVSHSPIELFIESANTCNLRCIMCHCSYGNDPIESPPISLELIEKIKDFCPGLLQAHLHGFGEPLVNRNLTEILHTIRRSGGPVVFDFFTNAMLMSRKVSESLVDAGVNRITLSIDGATKATYEAVHRGANWERLLKNLSDINDVKRETGSLYPKLGINLIAMNMNFHEFPGLVKFAADHDIGRIEVKNLVLRDDFPEEIRQQKRFYDPESDDKTIGEAKRIAEQHGIEMDFGHYFSSRVTPWNTAKVQTESAVRVSNLGPQCDCQDRFHSEADRLNICFQPWKTFYVKSNGEVKPCCFTNMVMGDLQHETPEEIWNGVEYRQLRDSISRGVYPEGCRHCVAFNLRPQMDDTDHLLQKIVGKHLLDWGEELFSRGDIASAIKIFLRVLQTDKTNSRALNNLGVIQWEGGDAVSAMETFQIALGFNPKDPDALTNLTKAATATGRFDLLRPEAML